MSTAGNYAFMFFKKTQKSSSGFLTGLTGLTKPFPFNRETASGDKKKTPATMQGLHFKLSKRATYAALVS